MCTVEPERSGPINNLGFSYFTIEMQVGLRPPRVQTHLPKKMMALCSFSISVLSTQEQRLYFKKGKEDCRQYYAPDTP